MILEESLKMDFNIEAKPHDSSIPASIFAE
jgi:hypothetical protein